ncbi:MAG: hypothetical protein WC273_06795 [Dehalococcoidia bacterium]
MRRKREWGGHMRFKQSDLGAIVVAALFPAMLSFVVFHGWGLLHHEGTPLLSIIATTLAIGSGAAAYLMRFLVHREGFGVLAVLWVLTVAGIIEMQLAEIDHTGAALALKWVSLLVFLALNALLIADVLSVAVNPYLERRDARRAAGR